MIKAWDKQKFYKKANIGRTFYKWSEVLAYSGDSQVLLAVED